MSDYFTHLRAEQSRQARERKQMISNALDLARTQLPDRTVEFHAFSDGRPIIAAWHSDDGKADLYAVNL